MPSDDHRLLKLTPDIGGKPLLVRTMSGSERLGELFEYELEVVSENIDVAPKDILGETVHLALELDDSNKRNFHGVVCEFTRGDTVTVPDESGTTLLMAVYRLVLRPWAWLLTRRADSRIFQELNVPDIVKRVFNDEGYSDVEVRLTKSYTPLDYCVQYRETHFNFVSRLLEQEGIHYFFSHDTSKHSLVLIDAVSSHDSAPGYEEILCRTPGQGQQPDNCITGVSVQRAIQPGMYALKDYNFETPAVDLSAKSTKSQHKHLGDNMEIYDYPGEYSKAAQGKAYATVRFEEVQARYERYFLEGNVRGIGAGNTFKLAEAENESFNQEYLVVAASYRYRNGGLFAGDAQGVPEYYCSFEAVKPTAPFRPARNTPKPVVQGPQTAVVVGPSGEDIWTDKYARVKVMFHWDRAAKGDENSSCWVRVAQIWAGKNWGAMHLPRIGQEVIVDFLEGDPDRPIITGRVYNADQMPPYKLPDHQTKSGVKSQSTPDGDLKCFNEIRFDDKKGEEEFYVHAERNYNRVVENDDTLKVGFDDTDKGDQTIDIHNNQCVTIGNSKSDDGSQIITVWKDRTTKLVKGNDTLTVEKGNRLVKVESGDETLLVDKGDRSITVKSGNNTHVVAKGDRKVEIKMGNDKLIVGMGNRSTDVKLGKHTTKAMQSIELKVGGNSLKIDQMGISIKGIMVKIQGNAMLDMKAPMTTVKGMGMLVLKGGITMIN